MKKYKYLVATGCSFTKGDGMYKAKNSPDLVLINFLERQRKNRFSKKLSEKLNCEEINIADAGASNDRIFRTLFDWLEENEEKVKDSLFVVGLTDSFRKDLYSLYKDKYIISSEIFQDIGSIAEDCNASKKEVEQWRNFELKYMIKESEIERQIIRDCVLFDSYITQRGSDIIFFNAWRRSNVVHPKLKFVHFGGDKYKEYNWADFIRTYDPTWGYSHPYESHHHRMADILYRFINEKL